MQDPLPITPFRHPLEAQVTLPGSKSITNRALLLAALAEGTTVLKGALFSRDTELMLEALQTLGFDIKVDRQACAIEVRGGGGQLPKKKAQLKVGNAGTAARFLTAMLALHPDGRYDLDGDPAMRKRPMSGLTDALAALGAAEFIFHGEAGHFPFTMVTKGYPEGAAATVDARASSQILSALLLAGPASGAHLTLTCAGVRPAYVEITQEVRRSFGACTDNPGDDDVFALQPCAYKAPEAGGVYQIEPDVSAASYFLALNLIHGGTLHLPGLGAEPMQGDARFAAVLSYHGLSVEVEAIEDGSRWHVESPGLEGLEGVVSREIDFETFSDTFLTYAAIAPIIGGDVSIVGIEHTRRQETDRIAGMARELAELGQMVQETSGALTIAPNLEELRVRAIRARRAGRLLTVKTYDDHRFAMSFGILGTYDLLGDGKPWLAIHDPACCGKTFPSFFEVLEACRPESGAS